MKIWNKTTSWTFGDTIISWRQRDSAKFFWKIFSWLLGGFVFGILAAIFFIAIHRPDYAQPTARLVFFIVFLTGVLSNFFRAVVYGYKYTVTPNALIYSHPLFGWETLGKILGSDEMPFGQTYHYVTWEEVKEIREHPKGVTIVLKNEEVLDVPVVDVLKLAVHLNLKRPERKEKGASKSEKLAYDKAVQRIVLQEAREARKNIINAKS